MKMRTFSWAFPAFAFLVAMAAAVRSGPSWATLFARSTAVMAGTTIVEVG